MHDWPFDDNMRAWLWRERSFCYVTAEGPGDMLWARYLDSFFTAIAIDVLCAAPSLESLPRKLLAYEVFEQWARAYFHVGEGEEEAALKLLDLAELAHDAQEAG